MATETKHETNGINGLARCSTTGTQASASSSGASSATGSWPWN